MTVYVVMAAESRGGGRAEVQVCEVFLDDQEAWRRYRALVNCGTWLPGSVSIWSRRVMGSDESAFRSLPPQEVVPIPGETAATACPLGPVREGGAFGREIALGVLAVLTHSMVDLLADISEGTRPSA